MRGETRLFLAVAVIALGWLLLPKAHERPLRSEAKLSAPPGNRINYPAKGYPRLYSPDGSQHVVKSVLNASKPLHYGDYIWDDAGVPQGRVWVRVDLKRQTLSIFRDDHEIGSSVILYGTDGSPTPTGSFPILERATVHRSTLYDANMPYMLRLTNDGVAIHASNVRFGAATHGCIGVPPGFAASLFAEVRRGDVVTILPAA